MADCFACDICFSEYDFNDHRPVGGSCGHSLCFECSRRINGTCPKCRQRSFDNPRTNFGMLELIENRRIEKERAEMEQKDLLRAVQETFDEVQQEKMLQKLSLGEKKTGQGSSSEGIQEEIPREVVLESKYENSGIKICGIHKRGPIIVSFIIKRSPAEGLVRVGDQILSVNGESLLERTLDDAEEILRNTGNHLKLRLQYIPQELQKRKNVFDYFLQALLNEEVNPVSGEPFVRALDGRRIAENNALECYFGDILEITHKPHKNYWIARKVYPDESTSGKGAILSSECHKEYKRRNNKEYGIKEPSFSYLVVKKHFDSSIRPIVVLGALKEKLMKSLMEKRPNLMGRIISPSPNAIRALNQGNVYPIVIFIGPHYCQDIIDLSNGELSEPEAEKELAEVRELAKETPLFTKRFYGGDTFETLVTLALQHIDEESRPDYWIPSEDQSGLLC